MDILTPDDFDNLMEIKKQENQGYSGAESYQLWIYICIYVVE
jgi:hypothetical protein